MVTPHRTADSRLEAPAPAIAPVMVCVVLTGIRRYSIRYSVIAPDVSATTPSKVVILIILIPIVLMIRHPPDIVPSAIAAWHDSATQSGSSETQVMPYSNPIEFAAMRAAAIIPITF